MRYLGSKRKIIKDILPLMQAQRAHNMWWVEPFVGGGNAIAAVNGPRLGCDINPYLIACLGQIRDDPSAFPANNTEFDEDDYKVLKRLYKELNLDWYALIGFIGFGVSFGGKWMGGWSRNKLNTDYVAAARRSAEKQHAALAGCVFWCTDYRELVFTEPVLFYCDPPYKGTTKYKDVFDHDEFYSWCRRQKDLGHIVFVSEYSAPSDFICVWEKVTNTNFDSNRKNASVRVERLYTL